MKQITDDERALLTLVSRSAEPVAMSSLFGELNPGVKEGEPGRDEWVERQIAWFGVTVSLHEKNLVDVVHPADGSRPDLVIVNEQGRAALAVLPSEA